MDLKLKEHQHRIPAVPVREIEESEKKQVYSFLGLISILIRMCTWLP